VRLLSGTGLPFQLLDASLEPGDLIAQRHGAGLRPLDLIRGDGDRGRLDHDAEFP